MSRPHCHHCMRQLAYTRAGMVYTERTIDGRKMKLHKDCAPRFDAELEAARKLTAAEREQGAYTE